MKLILVALLSFAASITGQDIPIAVRTLPQLNLTNQYIFNYTLPVDTFTDHTDGNTRSLNLFLLQSDGNPVPADSWIHLQKSTLSIIGYVLPSVYSNQPSSGFYSFRVLALDTDGHSADAGLVVRILTPYVPGNYIIRYRLISFNPLVVNSLSHSELILIIHGRLSQYYGLRETDFVPEALSFVPSTGQSTISYNFTTKDFQGDTCNLEKIISFRRKLLQDTNRLTVFRPLMEIVGSTDFFLGPCSGLTADKPQIGTLIQSSTARVGQPFTFSIPRTSFTLPQGNTMSLTLRLLFGNGTAIPSFYWVSISNPVLTVESTINGYVSLDDSRGRQSFDFILQASTPLQETASQSIRLNIEGVTPVTNVITTITVQNVMGLSYNEITVRLSQVLSSYLNIALDAVTFTKIRSGTETTISWAFLNIGTTTCDSAKVSNLVRKMTEDRVTPTPEFQQQLESIDLKATGISIQATGICDVPFVQRPLPSAFNMTFGSIQTYSIPNDMFYDPTDGNDLMLSLLQNGNVVQSTSWIYLDVQNRMIYIVPMIDITPGRSTQVFQLRATDKSGAYVEENIIINILDSVPAWNFRFQIMESSTQRPYAQYAYQFQLKLIAYFNDAVDYYVIFHAITYSPILGHQIYWSNATFQSSSCSYSNIYDVYIRLYNAQRRIVREQFQSAMKPEFTITQVIDEHNGPCATWGARAPQLNVQLFASLVTQRTVSFCTVDSLVLPVKLFEDEVDGDLNTLIKYLTWDNETRVPQNSWLGLDFTDNTIYAVPNPRAWNQRPQSTIFVVKFNVEDSSQRKGQIQLGYTLSGSLPPQYYTITLTLNIFGMINKADAVQTGLILNELFKAVSLQPIKSLYPRSFSITSRNGNDGTAAMDCGICGLQEGQCDQALILSVRDVFLLPGTDNLRPGLGEIIASTFQITQVTEQNSGPCFNNPPQVGRTIPGLKIDLLGMLSYTISSDTFTDVEDGNADQLQLTLTTDTGETLTQQSWLQFDSAKRRITGLLTSDMNIAQLPVIASFRLTALDSGGKSVTQTIQIAINRASFTTYYRATMVLEQISTTITINRLQSIASLIGTYMGDNGANFHAVSYQESGSDKERFTIVWSNSSVQWDPCNFNQYYSFRSALKTVDGDWRQSFRNVFQPQFRLLSITDSLTGPCATDGPPTIQNPIDDVSIDSCRTMSFPIPETTFVDNEDGNTRSLSLTMLRSNGLPIENNDWLSFDQSLQTITIVASRLLITMTSSQLRFIIQAKDQSGQSAQTSIQLTIVARDAIPSHTVRMVYRLKGTTVNTLFTDVYKNLRSSLLVYLGEESWSRTVEYQELPQLIDDSTEQTLDLRNCLQETIRCDNASIVTLMSSLQGPNNAPSNGLQNALRDTFDIVSVESIYSGACKPEPPVVANTIPTIDVAFCGFLEYQIPADTFSDPADGNTRNLMLTILDEFGAEMDHDFYATLTSSTQTLTITLSNELWDANNVPANLKWRLRATNKAGLSVSTELNIRINDDSLQYSHYYNMNLRINSNNPESLASSIVTRDFMKITQKHLTGSETPNQIHIIKLQRLLPIMISLQWTTCEIKYQPCDRDKIREIDSKVINQLGANQEYADALSPQFTVIIFQILKAGPCAIANLKPQVRKMVEDRTVEPCSFFKTDSLKNYFQDEEDGTDLDFRITQIDERPVPANSWICVNHLTQEINAVISFDVMRNQKEEGYNITVRATDRAGEFVESSFLVKFTTDLPPQIFYQIKLTLTASSHDNHEFQSIYDLIDVMSSINSFYGTNATNVISYSRQNTEVIVTWSYCGLENKCSNDAANQHFARLVSSAGVPDSTFSQSLQPAFTLQSIITITDQNCNGPLNPPRPTVPDWTWTMSYCGGFRRQVPANLFIDDDEGDTRSLTLSLRTETKLRISRFNWMQFDRSTQETFGLASRSDALAHNSENTIYVLIARDKTGLEAELKVRITFELPQEPKYIYNVEYTKFIPSYELVVEEKILFMNKLTTYFGDQTTNNFGLISYQLKTNDDRKTQFCNCSVSYNPCDLALLRTLQNKMIGDQNNPTVEFNTGMRPQFLLALAYPTVMSPCGVVPNPPIVRNPIVSINMSLCSYFSYKIPANVFYDYDQGDTRSLDLTLRRTGSNQLMGLIEWVRLNSETQTLEALPTVEALLGSPPLGYPTTVVATDDTQLSANDDFPILLYGPTEVLQECSFLTTLKSTSSLAGIHAIDLLKSFTSSMATYFGITQEEIGLIGYQFSVTGDAFSFSWSYCSAKYSSLASLQSTMQVDYHGLVHKILKQLYETDQTTIRSAFRSAFGSQYTLDAFSQHFTKRCTNLPPTPPTPDHTLYINVTSSGGYSLQLSETLFYDREDGTTSKLKLMIADKHMQFVRIDSFINVEITQSTLYISMRKQQREESVNRIFTYYLVAEDSGGLRGHIKLVITRLDFINYPSPFWFTFYYSVTQTSTTYAKELDDIIKSLTTYYSYSSTVSVLVIDYLHGQSASSSSRILMWRPYETQTCTSVTYQRTKSARTVTGQVKADLQKAFPDGLQLDRIYITSTCEDQTSPPSPVDPVPVLNISYCSIFTHSLALTTFVDQIDGNIRNLNLRLLDANRVPVTSASSMQLDQSSLTLYTIASEGWFSSHQMTKFYLEATNSAGLSSTTSVSAILSQSPFISDCPCTSTFQRLPTDVSNVVDLDVAIQFLDQLKAYYKDSSIQTKLLQFTRTTSNEYDISWSNCSFSFGSRYEALYGLQESDRSTIDLIFDLLVNRADGSINSNMVSSFSKQLTVKDVNTSYDCIETPPEPQTISTTILAELCSTFEDPISRTLFIDKQDGDAKHLKLSLVNLDSTQLSKDSWVNFNAEAQIVFGTVTYNVRVNEPPNGYRYLLIATDKSGRSSNLTYVIRMANPLPIFEIKFIMAYRNNQPLDTTTAVFFSNMTKRLSSYLKQNSFDTQIFIHDYNIATEIAWSPCIFKCSPSTRSSLLSVLQQTNGFRKPLPNLVAALEPLFTVTAISEEMNSCEKTTGVVIITTIIVHLNASICGWFEHQLPSNAFTDNQGRVTSQFDVDMLFTFGSKLPLDWIIQYNQATQMVYGVAVGKVLSQQYTFNLIGSSIASKQNATTTLHLHFPEYPLIKQVVCSIIFEFEIKYNEANSDAMILIDILKTLSQVLETNTQQLHFVQYSKTASQLTVEWTNCTFFYLLNQGHLSTYYQYTAELINHVFSIYTSNRIVLDQKLFTAFQGQVTLISGRTNGNCTQPPPSPPKSNGTIVITASNCGLFYHHVSRYIFYNADGTDTRTMVLQLITSDNSILSKNSWVSISNDQIIYGTPTYSNQLTQPSDGYTFRLKATNIHGLSATTTVTVILNGPKTAAPVLSVTVISTIPAWNQTSDHHVIIPFFNSVAKYMGDQNTRLRLIGDVIYDSSSSVITLIFANCSSCDLATNLKLLELDTDSAFKQALLPEFAVSFVEVFPTEIDEAECDNTVILLKRALNVSFCQRLTLTSQQYLGIDYNSASEYFIDISSATNAPLPDDAPIWIDPLTWNLYVVPTPKAKTNQPSNGMIYLVTVKLKSNNIIVARQQLTLTIMDSPPQPSVTLSLGMRTTLSTSNQNMLFVNEIWNYLSTYLSLSRLSYMSFERISTSPFIFEHSFGDCSLPPVCDDPKVTSLISLIFNDDTSIRKEVTALFASSSYTIETFTVDCNSSPPSKPLDINITVTTCGLFKYKIPASFSVDSEDGDLYSMQIELRHYDGGAITKDSWIQINSATYEIIALPNEGLVRSYQIGESIQYLIIVRDKDGNEVSATLKVFFETSINSFLRISASFDSLLSSSTSYLDIQVQFLQRLADYLGYTSTTSLSRYHINTFSSTSTTSHSYFIKITDCNVGASICSIDDQKLQEMKAKLVTNTGLVNAQFKSSLATSFTIDSLSVESNYQRDSVPTVVTPISDITVTTCSMVVRNISAGTFYDIEDGDTYHLKLELITINSIKVASSYWIQLINYQLYFIPNGGVRLGEHVVYLRATDKCNQTVTTTITVTLISDTPPQFGYMITTGFSINQQGSSDVFYLEFIMRMISNYFNRVDYTLHILTYTIKDSLLTIKWANCTITDKNCDVVKINELSSLILTSMNVIEPNFEALFTTTSVSLVSVTEERSDECGRPTVDPPTPNFNELNLKVPICSVYNYQIPENVFSDEKDGSTRNLYLTLLNVDKTAIGLNSWLQFNSTTQQIYALVRYTPGIQLIRNYRYLLMARDSDMGVATVNITVSIEGSLPASSYRAVIKGRSNVPTTLPDVYLETVLSVELRSYFNEMELSNIKLERDERFPYVITYEFGFCKMRPEPCDCRYISTFQTHMTSLALLQQQMRPQIEVESLTEIRSGSCLNTKPPQLVQDLKTIIAVPGKTFTESIREDSFYDEEDGSTRNLSLTIKKSTSVTNSRWLSVSTHKLLICGIFTLEIHQEIKQQLINNRIEYNLIATDSCGKEAIDTFEVGFQSIEIKISYKIFFTFNGYHGDYMADCSLVQNVLSSVSKHLLIDINLLHIDSVRESNVSSNATLFILGIIDCDNETILRYRQLIMMDNGDAHPALVTALDTSHTLLDISDAIYQVCPTPSTPPPPITTEFPWWILILILVLAIIFLLLWLLWLCVPRCCPMCCASWFPCCFACCLGKYSSLPKEKEEDQDSFEEVTVVSETSSQDSLSLPQYKVGEKYIKNEITGDGGGDIISKGGSGRWSNGDHISIDSGMGQSDRFNGRDDLSIIRPPSARPLPSYSRSSSRRSSLNDEKYFSDQEIHSGENSWKNLSTRRRSYDGSDGNFTKSQFQRRSSLNQIQRSSTDFDHEYETTNDSKANKQIVKISSYHDPRSTATFGQQAIEQGTRVNVRQPVALKIRKEALRDVFNGSEYYDDYQHRSSSRRRRSSDISLELDGPLHMHRRRRHRSSDAVLDRPITLEDDRRLVSRRSKSVESTQRSHSNGVSEIVPLRLTHHRSNSLHAGRRKERIRRPGPYSDDESIIISPRSINLRLDSHPYMSHRGGKRRHDTSMQLRLDDKDLSQLLTGKGVRISTRKGRRRGRSSDYYSTATESPSSDSIYYHLNNTSRSSNRGRFLSENRNRNEVDRRSTSATRSQRTGSYELQSTGYRRSRRDGYYNNGGYQDDDSYA